MNNTEKVITATKTFLSLSRKILFHGDTKWIARVKSQIKDFSQELEPFWEDFSFHLSRELRMESIGFIVGEEMFLLVLIQKREESLK